MSRSRWKLGKRAKQRFAETAHLLQKMARSVVAKPLCVGSDACYQQSGCFPMNVTQLRIVLRILALVRSKAAGRKVVPSMAHLCTRRILLEHVSRSSTPQ